MATLKANYAHIIQHCERDLLQHLHGALQNCKHKLFKHGHNVLTLLKIVIMSYLKWVII